MYRSFLAILVLYLQDVSFLFSNMYWSCMTGCLGLVSTRCIDAVVAASTGSVLAGFLVRA